MNNLFKRFAARDSSKGFTLTELMVVIALLAVMATIILSSVARARKSSRDARRYGDLAQITISLEAYYNINQSYPSTGGQWWTWCQNGLDTTSRDITGPSGYIPNLAPTYIPFLPTDPVSRDAANCAGSGSYKGYVYRSDGVDYKIMIDGSAEIGTECMPGKQYDEPSKDETYCSMYTQGATAWTY